MLARSLSILAVLLGANAAFAAAEAARATLKTPEGKVVGRATLTATPNGTLLRVELDNVPPGERAVHIHAVGRCTPPTFESAGGHFAPGGAKHGFEAAKGPHAGDLPNIHVPASGQLSFERFLEGVPLSGGDQAILDADGAALVIHAKADDYRTDPAGAAGARIACGVIER